MNCWRNIEMTSEQNPLKRAPESSLVEMPFSDIALEEFGLA